LSIKDRSSVNLLGDIDNDLTPEEKEERRKLKEKYASTPAVKPASPVALPVFHGVIPSIDNESAAVPSTVVPDVASLAIAETKPVVAQSFSLPSDILPLPKTEVAPNAALNAMASSSAGTLPLPGLGLPNINLPF
jgi:hypothetical protein